MIPANFWGDVFDNLSLCWLDAPLKGEAMVSLYAGSFWGKDRNRRNRLSVEL
jgi:hypothetical protein